MMLIKVTTSDHVIFGFLQLDVHLLLFADADDGFTQIGVLADLLVYSVVVAVVNQDLLDVVGACGLQFYAWQWHVLQR